MAAVAVALAAWLVGAPSCDAGPKVFSLDQCSDQFVLALAPRGDIVGLSGRADDPDSLLRTQVKDLPIRRASAESVLAARPQVVVRFWGGDPRLDRALTDHHIAVARIEDGADFATVRANVRRVAGALDRYSQGEALIARMDAQLLAAGAKRRQPTSVLYVTPSGFTAGRGTLIDAILSAAGLGNIAPRPGYAPAPLETLALHPPARVVAGFFDPASSTVQRWAPGRHAILADLVRQRALAQVPGALIGCPAWFAGDAVAILAAAP